MTPNHFQQIMRRGLWVENPGLVQLLGLCPLLAISNTVVNAIGLGLATIFVLCATNVLVSMIRWWLHQDLRLPIFVLIIATFVTVVELLFQAFAFDLYLSLGIFIPLIVTNCAILGRAEAFASRQPVLPSLLDGLAHGLGFALVLLLLGAIRELLGRGSLLHGADMLLGERGAPLEVTILPDQSGILLAALPPGAFIALGLLIALRNLLAARHDTHTTSMVTLGDDAPADR
jgi:electron transport complex protein RnfE